MNVQLMQVLVLVGVISAVFWGVSGAIMRIAPTASYRIALANALMVVGVLLVIQRTGAPSYLLYPVADWVVLGSISLFRGGLNRLLDTAYRTPWTAWLPLLLAVALTAFVPPDAGSNTWLGLVWSGAAAWVGLSCFRECYWGLALKRFSRLARLAMSWPFLFGGVALLYRAVSLAVYGMAPSGGGSYVHIADSFLWAMLGLLLVLNFLLGTLSGGRLVLRIRELADRDYLTSCLNRRSIEARLRIDIDRSRRFDQALSCILFDLDFFKRINDSHGHDTGDAALKHVAQVALGVIRTIDALGRYGGEEFLVVLPGTDLAGARETAKRIQSALHHTALVHAGQSVPVTASFGVATLQAQESIEALVKRADTAMYQAKHLGRDRVEVSESE